MNQDKKLLYDLIKQYLNQKKIRGFLVMIL